MSTYPDKLVQPLATLSLNGTLHYYQQIQVEATLIGMVKQDLEYQSPAFKTCRLLTTKSTFLHALKGKLWYLPPFFFLPIDYYGSTVKRGKKGLTDVES